MTKNQEAVLSSGILAPRRVSQNNHFVVPASHDQSLSPVLITMCICSRAALLGWASQEEVVLWSLLKGMAHREKVMPSRELRSLESRCHTTGLDLTSLAWHITLFQVTMSLSASVSSPVKLEVKDRANCL